METEVNQRKYGLMVAMVGDESSSSTRRSTAFWMGSRYGTVRDLLSSAGDTLTLFSAIPDRRHKQRRLGRE